MVLFAEISRIPAEPQFLRRIRIGKARESLLAPDAATSVTEVALTNGFLHLARFSAYYRQMFGELPIHTLRRNKPKGVRGQA